MKNNLWLNYENKFPKKYWEQGFFDQKLLIFLQILAKDQSLKILDIGGGCFGTKILKNEVIKMNHKIYLLDPFVSKKPDWYESIVNWSTKEEYFDVVICRGAINYLEEKHFQKIHDFLKVNGVLFFNTFLKKPSEDWVEKEFINLEGEKGIEKSRLYGKKIEHELIFKNQNIKHFFNYYSLEDYYKFLSKFEISITQYKANSFLLNCLKKS